MDPSRVVIIAWSDNHRDLVQPCSSSSSLLRFAAGRRNLARGHKVPNVFL